METFLGGSGGASKPKASAPQIGGLTRVPVEWAGGRLDKRVTEDYHRVMNVLSLGLPFGVGNAILPLYRSAYGHEIRTLAVEGKADYQFEATETTADVIGRIAEDWPPDLLMCWLPELFPPPRAVEDSPIRTAAVVSDWNIYFPQVEYNLARYDLALTDLPGSRILELPGTRPRFYAPLYSQLAPVHRVMETPKDIDILFVGNLNHVIHRERARCLERIASLNGEFRVLITTDVFDAAYAQLLNRARIVFNHSVRGELNLRVFEALACGATLFLERDNEEVTSVLQNRIEVVLYTPDTLVDLLREYLAQPEACEEVARAGHAKSETLAGEHRLDAWVNWIARRKTGPRSFATFSEEERALADLLQYGSSLAPSQQALAKEEAARYLDTFGERPEFLTVAGLTILHALNEVEGDARRAATKEIMRLLNKASTLAPDAVVPWMNLAIMCRQASATEVETHCLEAVLKAARADYGGLLMGVTTDPYYIAWRSALAHGTARAEIVWAGAAYRLAEIEAVRGNYASAGERAKQSIAWWPGEAAPHRIWALAEGQSGHVEESARILRDALPLTTFDAEYRMELVRTLVLAGQREEAERVARESSRLLGACSTQLEQARAFETCIERFTQPQE